jgi:hypothetical protein
MIDIIFIIPYRAREEQKHFFNVYMRYLLEDMDPTTYEIVFAHQKNELPFNRGAMKNIGFLYAKNKYLHYKDIIFVFNDIDTLPYKKGLLDYSLKKNEIKHYYGFYFTLGGIFAIKGKDFEKINGFPNYWAWGYEDNAFQQRVLSTGLAIDRSQFYPIMDKNIMQLKDGVQRMVNRQEYDKYINEMIYKQNNDGIFALKNVNFVYDDSRQFLNVTTFTTPIPENPTLNRAYDMRNGPVPFRMNNRQRAGRRLINMGGIR